MAIFFSVLILIIFIPIILIVYSTLRIDIKEFELINKRVTKFQIIISLNFLNKLKWLRLKIDDQRLDKLKENYKVKFINKILDTKLLKKYKNINKILFKDWKVILKELQKFEIEKFKLEAEVSAESPEITAYIVAIISIILAIILAKKKTNPIYTINPKYIGKNYIFLSINCIIAIKLVHIINISNKIKGKEVYQNNGRTSNRRTYANSNG